MKSVLRSVGAVVVAFVAASAVMMVVESINGRFLYPDLGKAAEGMKDKDAIRQLLAAAPTGAFLVVIAGWALGSIVGGWVAARIAARAPAGHALVLGGLLTLAGIANNLMMSPPLWFWCASLVVMVPAAYAGGRLARRAS